MSDGTKLWVVWEANALIPQLFTNYDDAATYQRLRQKVTKTKHPVYMQPSDVDKLKGIAG